MYSVRGGRTGFNFHMTIMHNVECNYQPGELCSDASYTFLAKFVLESLLLNCFISQKLLLDQPGVKDLVSASYFKLTCVVVQILL